MGIEMEIAKSLDDEIRKCLESPYYFATKYWKVNGKPFTTNLSEEEFNRQAKEGMRRFVRIKNRRH